MGSSVTPNVHVAIAPVVSEETRTVTDPLLQSSPEGSLPTASTVSTEGIVGRTSEEPSTPAIVSTTSDAPVVDETAVINSVSEPSATQPVLDEPSVVTTPPAPLSTGEPVIETSASHEAPAEVSQSEALTANGTSTQELDSAFSMKAAEDIAAPDSMVDEKTSQEEPASPLVDGTTEDMKPVTVHTSGSQPRNESRTNGHGATPAAAPVVDTKVQRPSAPTILGKKSQQSFPTSSPSNSPTKSFASKVGTDSRKKKTSIFGKVKHLFSDNKEEKQKK